MYAESHSSGPDLASSLTMDYNSLISHDSDTLFSTDFNFSELDVFGFSNLENQDESQCDERLSPWMEPQNNSLDMNNGFDFMFSMVNPRSVMADMSNHTSIQRNMNFDTQTVANGSEVELISDNPEVSESTNWSIHQHHNESEPESDEDHDYEVTESEAENEKNEQQGVKNANHTSVNFKSTIVINNDTSQKKFSAPVETKKPIQMQKIRVDDVNIHNIQVVPNSNRMQQLRRQIYNNNMQARFIAEQQQQSTQSAVSTEIKLFNCSKISKLSEENLDRLCKGKCYPKPTYSYSCLIAMALKNSQTGLLPVSEIYKFM